MNIKKQTKKNNKTPVFTICPCHLEFSRLQSSVTSRSARCLILSQTSLGKEPHPSEGHAWTRGWRRTRAPPPSRNSTGCLQRSSMLRKRNQNIVGEENRSRCLQGCTNIITTTVSAYHNKLYILTI